MIQNTQFSPVCPVCGTPVPSVQGECPACGCNMQDFLPQTPESPEPPQKKPSRAAIPVGLVLCLLAVLCCVLGAVRIRSDQLQKSVETIRICKESKEELEKLRSIGYPLSSLTRDYDRKQELAQKELNKIRTTAAAFWCIGAFAACTGSVLLYRGRRRDSKWKW